MNHLLASGPHLAVIPTLTALAVRHFRHKQGQDDGGAGLEPKHPAVRFVLGAWNEGDFSEADKHVAPGIGIYASGLSAVATEVAPMLVDVVDLLQYGVRSSGIGEGDVGVRHLQQRLGRNDG